MRFWSRKAQSIPEYALLVAVVISALLVMQFYIKRAYQGGLKEQADNVGPQYSPGHTTSNIITTTSSSSTTRVGGSGVPDGATQTTGSSSMTTTRSERVEAYQ